MRYGIIPLTKEGGKMGDDIVNSQDIKTLTLLLQIKQNNQGVKNDFLENQISDLITSLKMQGADLSDIISICQRYGYNLNQ